MRKAMRSAGTSRTQFFQLRACDHQKPRQDEMRQEKITITVDDRGDIRRTPHKSGTRRGSRCLSKRALQDTARIAPIATPEGKPESAIPCKNDPSYQPGQAGFNKAKGRSPPKMFRKDARS